MRFFLRITGNIYLWITPIFIFSFVHTAEALPSFTGVSGRSNSGEYQSGVGVPVPATVGLPLVIGYDSSAGVNPSVGKGWKVLIPAVEKAANGTVSLLSGFLREDLFPAGGSNEYISRYGTRVKEFVGSRYEITLSNGTELHFSHAFVRGTATQFLLTSIADRFGRTSTLSYNPGSKIPHLIEYDAVPAKNIEPAFIVKFDLAGGVILNEIRVNGSGQLITKYTFDKTTSSTGDLLLEKVSEYGPDNTLLSRKQYTYYDQSFQDLMETESNMLGASSLIEYEPSTVTKHLAGGGTTSYSKPTVKSVTASDGLQRFVMQEKKSFSNIVSTKYWDTVDQYTVQCKLCPRACKLKEGQRGVCFVRSAQAGEIVLNTYGRSSGFCIDPIEKKPLYHFFPGTGVLSFGTAGCNLTCKFCQNWDISKSQETDTLADQATPKQIASAAADNDCKSIAFTYNDPIIFLEYAVDVAAECHNLGLQTVAVTSGYMCEKPRREFFQYMDAANVDLKAFTERFYKELCSSKLQPVLDTLLYLRNETDVWFEITTLLIPGENDSDEELDKMTTWIVNNLGADTPIHFSAFHPAYRMLDKPPTPAATLTKAREIAIGNGMHFAYTGNVHDENGGSTYCSKCEKRVVGRDWYVLTDYQISDKGFCAYCNDTIPGRFAGPVGTWGTKRVPLHMNRT